MFSIASIVSLAICFKSLDFQFNLVYNFNYQGQFIKAEYINQYS